MDEEDLVVEARTSIKNVNRILLDIRKTLDDINIDVYLSPSLRLIVSEQRKALDEIDRLLKEVNI